MICGPWDAEEHALRDYVVRAGLSSSALGDEAALICEHHRRARCVVRFPDALCNKKRVGLEFEHVYAPYGNQA